MNCLEFRRILGSEPNCHSPDFTAHRADCAACARAAAEALQFETRLARAVAVTPPPDLERRLLLSQAFAPSRRYRTRLAAAATILIAFGIGALLPGMLAERSLGAAVVEHVVSVDHAPPGAAGVDAQTLAKMFGAIGIRVGESPGAVRAASLCAVRDRTVAHLVLGEGDARMDVLLMPGESLPEPERIHHGRLSGVMLPANGGVLALLGEPRSNVDAVGRRLNRSLRMAP